jgi:hypothetical protein
MAIISPMENQISSIRNETSSFTPVALRARHDGFTPERQVAFIEALAASGSIRHASKSAGISRDAAYQLRRKAGAENFAEAWDAALRIAVQTIADNVMEQAVSGEVVRQYYKGEVIGERVKFDTRLQMFLLRVHDNRRYGKHADNIRQIRNSFAAAKVALKRSLGSLRKEVA